MLRDTLIAYAAVGAWLLVLWVVARIRGRQLTYEVVIKPIHVSQPTVHFIVLVYLSLYWVGLRSHWPWLMTQIGFCYLADAAFSYTRHGHWKIGFAPVPVVFSTNLFLFYEEPFYYMIFVVYLIAFFGKGFITWKGRHVFNPSALGMTVVTLGWWFSDRFPYYHAIDHEFWLGPNIVEVLFLVSLYNQYKNPIIWITLGAYFGLKLPILATNHPEPPHVFYPAAFIAILLLLPDPATSAKTPPGQFLYGIAYALAFKAISFVAIVTMGNTGSGKIMGVIVANILAPLCDRIGAAADPAVLRFMDRRYNFAHWVLWIVVIHYGWSTEIQKETLFPVSAKDHRRVGNPWVVFNADGTLDCDDNPVYCEKFSFGEELGMWIRGGPAR